MAGKKGRSGRKPKSLLVDRTDQTIKDGAMDAAKYLVNVARGDLGTYTRITTKKNGDIIEEVLPISADQVRVETCKYIVNQTVGMPKQRQEISGEDGKSIKAEIIVTSDNAKRLTEALISGQGTESREEMGTISTL